MNMNAPSQWMNQVDTKPMDPAEAAALEWARAKAQLGTANAEATRAIAALEQATDNEKSAWLRLEEVAGRGPKCSTGPMRS